MSKMWKAAKITILSVIGLLAVVVGAALSYRAHLQHMNARAIAIHSPNGIDEGMYVKVSGINQWIQIRGQDRNNPMKAILNLHQASSSPPHLPSISAVLDCDFRL